MQERGSSEPQSLVRKSSHVHLAVLPASTANETEGALPKVDVRKMTLTRWAVVAVTLVAMGLYAASFWQDWWKITLFAPQYPKGLNLAISLTGLSGDVREVDMLNHYIGMSSLNKAAQFERQYGGFLLGGLGLTIVAATLLLGRRLNALLSVLALAFPLGFLADSFYWMYRFGHDLDKTAPIRMKPFTPQLFGDGTIGQFHTNAFPLPGFWLALAGSVLLVIAFVARRRVCSHCAHAKTCTVACPHALVLPQREKKETP